jgi:hypothetical protein
MPAVKLELPAVRTALPEAIAPVVVTDAGAEIQRKAEPETPAAPMFW